MKNAEVAIIGAGLAGICCAYALAKRGISSLLLEKSPHIAIGASGNADGLLAPYFDNALSARAKFYQSGFKLMLKLLNQLSASGLDTTFRQHGIAQLPSVSRIKSLLAKENFNPDQEIQVEKLDAAQTSAISGIEIEHPALFFPQAGSLNPPGLCKILLKLAENRAALIVGEKVVNIKRCGESWQLECGSGRSYQSSAVIIANAHAADALPCSQGLVLNKIRGQVMQLPCSEHSARLKVGLSYDGYVIPARAGMHIIGASYANKSFGPQNTSAETEHILKRLRFWLPTLAANLPAGIHGRASFRTNSIDRLPYVGEIPGWPGVFASLAHGSRGLVTCFMSAEYLAQRLSGQLNKTEFAQWEIVDPARSIKASRQHAAA